MNLETSVQAACAGGDPICYQHRADRKGLYDSRPAEQFRYVLSEYLAYYHTGRVHQGLGKIINPRHEGNTDEIFCTERLGDLLKSYHRRAV